MKTWIPTTEVNRFQRCGIMKYSLSHTALLAKIDMTELNLQSGVKKKKELIESAKIHSGQENLHKQ